MAEQPISASDRHPRKQIAVLDSKMSYVDNRRIRIANGFPAR